MTMSPVVCDPSSSNHVRLLQSSSRTAKYGRRNSVGRVGREEALMPFNAVGFTLLVSLQENLCPRASYCNTVADGSCI